MTPPTPQMLKLAHDMLTREAVTTAHNADFSKLGPRYAREQRIFAREMLVVADWLVLLAAPTPTDEELFTASDVFSRRMRDAAQPEAENEACALVGAFIDAMRLSAERRDERARRRLRALLTARRAAGAQ